MTYKVKIGDNYLDEVFDTEDEAEEAAWDALTCYSAGAEALEMMGGEGDEIDFSNPDYEIVEDTQNT